MKKTIYLFLALLSLLSYTSCNDYITYAEQKENERKAINNYLKLHNVKTISEQEFKNNGCKTDTAKNEWVLLQKSSVYMQIINDGTFYDANHQKKDLIIKPGETSNILCRFFEVNLLSGDTLLTNMAMSYIATPEKMTVTRQTDTFEGSFIYDVNTYSLMYAYYNTAAIPSGWLVPLMYLNIGRIATPDDDIAKVRLIVPHAAGTAAASQSVYPTYYEITYQKAP